MNDFFATIGVVVTIVVVISLLVFFVVKPIDMGWWAMDRFGWRSKESTIVLRQDTRAKPLWICADGSAWMPSNCLSRDELIKVLRRTVR